jgi:hypothetical protein
MHDCRVTIFRGRISCSILIITTAQTEIVALNGVTVTVILAVLEIPTINVKIWWTVMFTLIPSVASLLGIIVLAGRAARVYGLSSGTLELKSQK